MVMDFMPLGSLDHFLPKIQSNPNCYELMMKMAQSGVSGLLYLTNQNIVHRDIAARNFLVDEKKQEYYLKIADFGLSRNTTNDNIYHQQREVALPVPWTGTSLLLSHTFSKRSI